MKLIILSLIFCSIFFQNIFCNPKSLELENEFIKIVVNNVDSKGRFSLETTLGNPDQDNDNYQDLILKADLDIKPVRWIDEVLDIVLTRQPIPWEKEEVSDKVSSKKSRAKKSSVKAH